MVREVSPSDFVTERAAQPAPLVVDVREAWELEVAKLPDTLHIPMAEVQARLAELPADASIIVMCRSGGRSLAIARFLEARGYGSVANLTGGILAYARDIDPSLATY
jgi:rhodanese-related sulfurtransferase